MFTSFKLKLHDGNRLMTHLLKLPKETMRKEIKITHTRVPLSMIDCCPKYHHFSRKYRKVNV